MTGPTPVARLLAAGVAVALLVSAACAPAAPPAPTAAPAAKPTTAPTAAAAPKPAAAPTTAPAAAAKPTTAAKPAAAVPTTAPAAKPAEAAKPAAPPRRGGELVVALTVDLFSTDPQMGGTISAVNYNMAIAEPLVIMGKEGLDPWLIESWDSKPDGTYTWRIRKGVNFSDGTPLNAEAVKFSADRIRDPKNEMRYRSYFANTERIRVVDEFTLEVKNKTYDVEFMERMINISVVSPTAVQRLGENFRTQPVGTGPFTFQSYTRGERIVLQRNPNYWRQNEPYVDRLVMRFIPEEAVRLAELEAGTVHVAMDMGAAGVEQARRANLQVLETPKLAQQMVYFNLSRITDVNVRRAVNHAINREAIVQGIFRGTSEVSHYPMPRAVWAYDPTIPTWTYDVEKAKKLLDDAGWRVGADGIREKDGQKLVWDMPADTITSRLEAAEAVAGMLKQIGIQANIRPMNQLTLSDTTRKGEYDIVWWEWAGSSTDPWSYNGGLGCKYAFNLSQYCNEEMDKLLAQALVETDREKRKALYKPFFTQLQDQALVATVAHRPTLFFARPEANGVFIQGGRLMFHGTWLAGR